MDLSRDGSVVAGEIGFTEVFRWKVESGAEVETILDIAGAETLTFGMPALSADGSIIVVNSDVGGADPFRLLRWDVDADVAAVLPTGNTVGIDNVYPGTPNGTITPRNLAAISADGNTITGRANATDGNGVFLGGWGFRWTATGGTSDLFQDTFSDLFIPQNIAADGTTIVGFVYKAYPTFEAAVWDPAGGGAGVGTNLGIPSFSNAIAVSADGSLVAGWRPNQFSQYAMDVGFTWMQAGGVEDLARLLKPRGFSDDSTVMTSLETPTPTTQQPWVDVDDPSASFSEPLFNYLGSRFGLGRFFQGGGLYGGPSYIASGLVSGDGTVFTMPGATWVAKVTPLSFVALGDSFSSGEGIPDFLAGTDVNSGVQENRCHRSSRAYAFLTRPRSSFYTLEELAFFHQAYEWNFAACSGAETDHVRSTPADSSILPQYHMSGIVGGVDQSVRQLQQTFVNAETDLVTITIGGNDAQFERIATFCFFNYNCQDDTYRNTGKTLRAYLNDLVRVKVKDALEDTFEQIKLEAPNATVVVLGYPMLFGSEPCGAVWNENELTFFQNAGRLLNQVIAGAAAKEGVHWVPVAQRFERHAFCDVEQAWINRPILVGNKEYGLHPNGKGQSVYAEAVMEFLQNTGIYHPHGFFESGMPKNPPPQP